MIFLRKSMVCHLHSCYKGNQLFPNLVYLWHTNQEIHIIYITLYSNMIPYFEEADIAVTICDKEGKIIEMNGQSREVNLKPGQDLIGKNVLDCHPEPARSLLEHLMTHEEKHVYTITKGSRKKLIYQIPWYQEGAYAGFIELSMIIPEEMPHYIRKPKTE